MMRPLLHLTLKQPQLGVLFDEVIIRKRQRLLDA